MARSLYFNRKTKLYNMSKLILSSFFGLFLLSSIAQPHPESMATDFSKYAGFYNVGTKPGKSRFMARIYLDGERLMFSAPGGADSQISGYVGNHRFEGSDGYTIQFKVKTNTVESFTLYRPRRDWSTDLYGTRNSELDKLAESKQLALTEQLTTEHFTLRYTVTDTANAISIATNLEEKFENIISKFQVSEMPKVTVNIYPGFESYHLAVLSPGAPEWQRGMAWAANDIRMVSPEALDGSEREMARTGAAVHEFVHCVNMYLVNNVVFPRWLWEGVAMYVGCCQFYQPDELEYLRAGKRPSLDSNKHPERAYELGYFVVEYIESEFGWQAVMDLIKAGGDTRKVFQKTPSQFEKGFYDYLEIKYFE